MAHGLAKLSGALGKAMERQEGWKKAERHRQQYREHLERMAQGATAIQMGGMVETRGVAVPDDEGVDRARDAIVEQATAVIEQLGEAMGGG